MAKNVNEEDITIEELKANGKITDEEHEALSVYSDAIINALKYPNIGILIKDCTEEEKSGIIRLREMLVAEDKRKGIFRDQKAITDSNLP